jgi:Lrp/AsnC family transcriptional regulator for asnA, asnC and gidA
MRPVDVLELAPSLSAFDRALIRLLQVDGRMSFARLAEELGESKKLVSRRVQDLQSQGVIKITTIADPELLGYGLTALVGVRAGRGARPTELAARIAETPFAFYVMVTSGLFNVLVEVTCRDTDHLLEIVERDICSIDGVDGFELFPYVRLEYQNPSFEESRRKSASLDGAPASQPEFDETDRAIISMLSDDGRMPYSTIGTDLGISESQVRQRVNRMVAAGSVRIMALTNPRGVGFATTALIGIEVAAGASAEEVATTLAKLPRVIYVAICAGRYAVLAEAVCADRAELLHVMDTEIRQVPGVATADPWIYFQLHYRNVSPAPGGMPAARHRNGAGDGSPRI